MDYYRERIAYIRETIPGVTLATDIIVGFPGETAEQFEHTLELLSETRIRQGSRGDVFAAAGTLSNRWEDEVP